MKKIQSNYQIFIITLVSVFVLGGAMHQSLYAAGNSAESNQAARWAFDEENNTDIAEDLWGNNDGTPSSPPPTKSTSTAPAITFDNPYSRSFDGSTYFTVTRPVENNFTICAWINTTGAGNGTSHFNSAPILDSEVNGVTNDFGFGVGSDGRLSYGNGPVTDSTVHGDTVVNDGEWHHGCITRDNYNTTSDIVLYVDSAQDKTGTTDTGTLTANANARIGWGYDGAAALYNGLIDDIRVYDVALSAEQIANLYAGSNNPDSSTDNDGDGIDNSVENAAPNSGDANGDGTEDSSQANVTSIPNTKAAAAGAYITLQSSGGDCNAITALSMSDEASNSADNDFEYPVGLADFTITCDNPGDTATITIFYDKTYDTTGWSARKFIGGTYSSVTGATFGTATVGSNTVTTLTYSVTDGGTLDADGTANGTIVDPVGPGTASQVLAETGINKEIIVIAAISLVIGGVGFIGSRTVGYKLKNTISR